MLCFLIFKEFHLDLKNCKMNDTFFSTRVINTGRLFCYLDVVCVDVVGQYRMLHIVHLVERNTKITAVSFFL